MFPVTFPVRLPVTLPVTLPVRSPVTSPVNEPTNPLEVVTPETVRVLALVTPRVLIPELTFPSTLPVTLPVTFPVTAPVTPPTTSPVNAPTKLVAVIIPVALILPIELIPTPFLPATPGVPPTWKLILGSVVAIPTLPAANIEVYPKPTSTSTHCDVGRLDKVEPSP